MNERKKGSASAQQATTSAKAAKMEPAYDSASLFAAIRAALVKPSVSHLIRLLQTASSSCKPTDAEIQELAALLAALPPETRMDFYVRLEREHSAEALPGSVWVRITEALRALNTRRTEWLADTGARLISHTGALDPRRFAHIRREMRSVLEDDTRAGEMLPELLFRLVRKEKDAPLVLAGLFIVDALSQSHDGAGFRQGAPVVDALASLLTGILKAKHRPTDAALRVGAALVRHLEQEAEAGDAAATRSAANERKTRELEHEIERLDGELKEAAVRSEALQAELADRERRIASLEAQIAEEQSRYRLLDDASRSARSDSLRGLLARLRRHTQHELGDLLEAVGDARDERDRHIRARAENVLRLLEDEAAKIEGQ